MFHNFFQSSCIKIFALLCGAGILLSYVAFIYVGMNINLPNYLNYRTISEEQNYTMMDDGFNHHVPTIWDFYVVGAYYYHNSQSLGNNSIALILSGHWSNKLKYIELTAWNDVESIPVTFHLEKVLENITNAHTCQWNSYFATAITLQNLTTLTIKSGGVDHKIPFKLPVQEKHNVVTCVAPLFTMEQWQEMLFALHIYRQFESHVHVYVRSMLTSIYKVLQFYERENYLTYQPWSRFGMQTVSSKVFNPNYWVEFRAQDAAQTDCLLQYKESASFITFMDLDDVIVPKQGRNYLAEFNHIFNQEPMVQYFRYQKWNTEYKITRDPKLFSVNKMIHSLKSTSNTEYGKYVIKPSQANSSWIHWPTHSARMQWRNVSAKYATIVHLKGVEESDEYYASIEPAPLPRFNLSALRSPHWDRRKMRTKLMIGETNLRSIELETRRMQSIPGYKEAWLNLPKTPFYGPLISKCYKEIFYSIPWNSWVGWVCTNPDRCNLPKSPGIRCTNARAKYRSIIGDSRVNLHFSTDRWLEDEDGCVP